MRKVWEIYTKTKIPFRTIQRNLKRLRESGSIESKTEIGRQNMISPVKTRAIGQWVWRNNRILFRTMVAELETQYEKKVAYVTIYHHLKKKSHQSSVPTPTPMITTEQRIVRLGWALWRQNDDWKRKFFVDETAFSFFGTPSVFGTKFKVVQQESYRKIAKSNGIGRLIYSRLSAALHLHRNHGFERLHRAILKDNLLPKARRMFGNRWRLIQDNDPKHKSKKPTEFLNQKKFKVLNWSANSPDLNPRKI